MNTSVKSTKKVTFLFLLNRKRTKQWDFFFSLLIQFIGDFSVFSTCQIHMSINLIEIVTLIGDRKKKVMLNSLSHYKI